MNFEVGTAAKGTKWHCSASDQNGLPSTPPCSDGHRRSIPDVQQVEPQTQVTGLSS